VNVCPRSAGGTTLLLIPLASLAALLRSAAKRAAAFAYGASLVLGDTIGAARSSAPARVGAAAGEPDAALMALKLWNGEDASTPATVARSLLRPWGSGSCVCGAVPLLQPARTKAAATASPPRH